VATPSTSTYAYPLPLADVSARYAAGDGDRYDLLAGAWAITFYALWGAWLAGWLPTLLFGLLGVCAFVRNFNALHEGFHARRPTGRAKLLRHLFVVTSPFMLGYHPLRKNHAEHHTWAQQPARDPDAYLAHGPWWLALFHAVTQPEQGFFRYLRRKGWSRELVGRLVLHSVVFGAVVAIGGPVGTLGWVVVTRIGNTASWFIFDWILHHDGVWGRWVWMALFGADNLLGVEYHHVHHHYPFVPGPALPALAEELQRAEASGHAA
jgi:fatty acid desaturase